jgi:hypothetical protein
MLWTFHKTNSQGEIPQELTQPTFLSFFNMYYHKDLMGSTPQGKQFSALNNNPYEGNSCGSLLSKKCETSPSPSSFDEDHESESSFEFGWKPVVMGYASGFIIGAVIGDIALKTKREWLLKIFSATQQKMRRIRASTMET